MKVRTGRNKVSDMKTFIVLLLLLVSVASMGQPPGHKTIPGTKCSLIPPPGFELSAKLSGFQNSSMSGTIMVLEFFTPVEKFLEGYTEEALSKKGLTVIDRQVFNFRNGNAVFIHQITADKQYYQQYLIFGDEKISILINGTCRATSRELEPAIKKSVLTASYNPDQDPDMSGAASFTIAAGNSGFRPTQFLSGTITYTLDNRIPTQKPFMIVGPSLTRAEIDDKKEFSIYRLKARPRGDESVIHDIRETVIDNMIGYEIIAMGKNGDKDELIYQTILFTEDGRYYYIFGFATEDYEKYKTLFPQIAKTFSRK